MLCGRAPAVLPRARPHNLITRCRSCTGMGLLAFGCPINNPDRAEKIWIDVNRLRFVNVRRHDWIMGIHVWAIESGILIGEDTVPETGLEVRFSHQDVPSGDGEARHRCRSGPCASEVSSVASRELAPRSRARSR